MTDDTHGFWDTEDDISSSPSTINKESIMNHKTPSTGNISTRIATGISHYLSAPEPLFQATWEGLKLFEVCPDDNIDIGNIIHLSETYVSDDIINGVQVSRSTGRSINLMVVSKLTDVAGLDRGLCIVGTQILQLDVVPPGSDLFR